MIQVISIGYMKIQIKLLNPDAKQPTRGSDFAAGYDLYTNDTYEMKPGERHLYKTGVTTAMPDGVYGRIAPRSGLAYKNGIDTMAGVIDSDYRGDIGVVLINLGQTPWAPTAGKPIAQIIFENHNVVNFESVETLPDSVRNSGGFGHTDEKKEVKKDETPSGNLIEKWQKVGDHATHIKYETIVREREKSIQ